ncbi:alpha/beta fold hydrolase [Acidicapsa dinghuensis]|uniref:Alpha/beta fold hydrolase n=1 Tax=Acidicapsa dinghuensis TaxID=2218256 RepID=A0ABW1EPR2_9BACT|nr:alpha/beta hydrolase [Acidicapsa dinghuensis]
MKLRWTELVAVGLMAVVEAHGQAAAPKPADTSSHTVQFVTVEPGVKLEVLDWGGTGSPLIFLAGLGSDAHVFDTFALKFTSAHHVYGISRRGYGKSDGPKPDSNNYSATRLADDVLTVMDQLKIEKPVLVGHSIAGEELSSIGTRFPERVAGLVYLDAGYPYAYYDPKAENPDPIMDMAMARHELWQLTGPQSTQERKEMVKEMLEVTLPRLQKDFEAQQKHLETVKDQPAPPDSPDVEYGSAVLRGVEQFTGVKCPALAIFAVPHNLGPMKDLDAAAKAKAEADDLAIVGAQVNAFEAGNPTARVVRIPHADHFIFESNEADVIREMNTFLAKMQ